MLGTSSKTNELRQLEIELGIICRNKPFMLEPYPGGKRANCKRGLHVWSEPFNVAGEQMVMCRHCGVQIFKRILDKTLVKNEHQKTFKERNWLFNQRQLLLRKRILDELQRR
jgi:hypothetical protein